MSYVQCTYTLGVLYYIYIDMSRVQCTYIRIMRTSVKIKLFSREGQIFLGGRILIFFLENVHKISTITMFWTVICPKPTPAPF